ncbi:MAG: hypothetical protein J6W75_02530 [Bacteroidaceae bacterium]|nr:hypothetical protein [Bacteroidaceae bacterium]
MNLTLKELIRLWYTQKRRDFTWKDVFISLYFTVLFVVMVVAFYFQFQEFWGDKPLPVSLTMAVPLIAVSIMQGDLLIKLFWRRSPVEMDDYLRTRPVSARDWGCFVLFQTSLAFLQWMLPLMVAFVVALFLSVGHALLALLLAFSVTMINALFQNCWRRAPGNEWTLPLVFGYLVWMVLAFAVVIAGFLLAAYGDFMLLTSAVLLLLNLVAGGILHWYFCRMKNHNEEAHSPVHTTAHSLGQVSLWSIEYVQLLRSKRLRTSFLAIVIVFLLNVYLQQITPQMQEDLSLHVNPMLLLGIGFPCIILAQWVLGVEANYFSGIWTKPWPLEGILLRKYYFFCVLCALMALLIMPAVLWMHLSVLSWLAALLFSCGIFVLPMMATCLYSSRMDLFSSAFFNYQGGNKQLNIFSFVMFLPMIIYYAAYIMLPSMWAHLLVGGLGVVGLLLHRWYIHWVASIWHRRRYGIMERWLAE